MIDNKDGRKWARFWLCVALLVSTIANVTHAVLATSEITLWLRVPGAVVWPLFTFAGIEILVRMIWEKRPPHTATQWVLLSAAVPAAITSYEHQYTLLGMMGERWIIQVIGPVAIDGLMIGCTMALLFTRKKLEQAQRVGQVFDHRRPIGPMLPTLAEREREAVAEAERILQRHEEQPEQEYVPTPEELKLAEQMAKEQEQPRRRIIITTTGGARASKPEQEKAVRLLLDGWRPEAVTTETGVSASTTRLYSAVMRHLLDNPNAEIGQRFQGRSVSAPLVSIIREHAQTERGYAL